MSGNTTEVTLAPGDSLNELARRFNTTAERLKELNPQISNWARVQPGQKVVVPGPAG
jgi:LysM repeat protein